MIGAPRKGLREGAGLVEEVPDAYRGGKTGRVEIAGMVAVTVGYVSIGSGDQLGLRGQGQLLGEKVVEPAAQVSTLGS